MALTSLCSRVAHCLRCWWCSGGWQVAGGLVHGTRMFVACVTVLLFMFVLLFVLLFVFVLVVVLCLCNEPRPLDAASCSPQCAVVVVRD